MAVESDSRRPGTLRVYLGAAPGVGKTFAMLQEGRRRQERGTDVVLGYVETHDRPRTIEAAAGFEVVPRRTSSYRGTTLEEMDTAAVIARRPEVVLVDELAHTNAPGSPHEKRWQDVEQILAAGIGVITTVNIQHLESLNDVIASITGTRQRETVPDQVVRRASQIELVDMAPEALRRRMAHGNVYQREKIDAALANYFRVGNLTALRELALLWVADRVDEVLQRYRTDHDIDASWPARERIVVAVTPDEFSVSLIRRGAGIAARASAAQLLVVYVQSGDGVRRTSPLHLEKLREISDALGGSFHEVVGEQVAQTVLDFARGANATQIVIGTSRRNRLVAALSPGVGDHIVNDAGSIDVHTVSRPDSPKRSSRSRLQPLSRMRLTWAAVLALVVPATLTGVLALAVSPIEFSLEVLLYLLAVVLVALVGGRWPALVAAILSGLLLNYFLTPPLYTLAIDSAPNILTIVVFVVVAIAVAAVVDRAARTRLQALRAQGRADTLSSLARQVLSGRGGLPALLETMRAQLGLSEAILQQCSPVGFRAGSPDWGTVASSGRPGNEREFIPVGDTVRLGVCGPDLARADRQILEAYAAHAAVLREHDRLVSEAAEARAAAAENQVRVSLLAAVSHDLRTPIATIKAATGTLLQPGLRFSEEDREALLADVDAAADALARLIGNLLDMSRLNTGELRPLVVATSIDAVVFAALHGIAGAERVDVDIPEDRPPVAADPGLLERVVANIVENGLRHAPDADLAVRASTVAERAEIRIIDTGPGVPDGLKPSLFEAFQRLDDSARGTGLGLGLAVASGFMRAMQGNLSAEDTPGGGLTMVVEIPLQAARTEHGGPRCAS